METHSLLYQKALEIAKTKDVSTKPSCLVLYSISFLPSQKNKDDAFSFTSKHKDKMVIEQTPCGKELSEIEKELTVEERRDIWAVASKRAIKAAKGDITAFVDSADPRSVFRSVELPEVLKNPDIETINHTPKSLFATKFT